MRVAFLGSGNGTTVKAIADACLEGVLLGIKPALVIASKDGIRILDVARQFGIPAVICGRKQFQSVEEFGDALLCHFKNYKIDVVGQYGWLCKTPSNVTNEYEGRIFNQHPGPLDYGYPGFGGEGMYGRAVHDARIRYLHETNPPEPDWYTEVVAHRVCAEYDSGPVLWSARVPVDRFDSAESLALKVLPAEWAVQIALLQMIATGTAHEIVRSERLVLPGTESILEEAKKEARQNYPHG